MTRLAAPLRGITVVELAVGTSDLGLGPAGGLPGMLLADLGAAVTRVVGTSAVEIDEHLPWGRAWHRDKQVVATDDADRIREVVGGVDIVLAFGSTDDVEQRGLGYDRLSATDPRIVYARCRASRTAAGPVDDYGLLVEARSGFCSQLAGHRPGPIFVDVRASGAGAAFLMTTSVLALLQRREHTGRGGWAETSLYDGMLATLGCMIGRSERAAPEIEDYWAEGSTFPNFLYRCADDELIQVWFGGKGMYAELIDVLGDEPSVAGYYTDQATGQLGVRSRRWREIFAGEPRDTWIERLRAVGVAAEPVLDPGEALFDPHLAEIGSALSRRLDGHDDVVVGTPITVTPLADTVASDNDGDDDNNGDDNNNGDGDDNGEGADRRRSVGSDLLAGLRVVDFSAFVAGPLAGQVMADLGADVLKVEPPQGEAMRAAAYAIAACQRGKRSLAIDINAPEARPIVEWLLRWADVVLHNFRVGVSERLGIDEASVARINPRAVYCHATAFGTAGPRATAPGNDALMQALTGFERAVGGAGNDPTAATWIPIDMTGGWVGATGILAGLYARAATGTGQRVVTSLLGSGMLLHSGVYVRDGEVVRGPALDDQQTGYGPGYRIYRAGDGDWFALVIPDRGVWQRLRSLPGAAALATDYTPVRTGSDDGARQAEQVLEAAFATAPAAEWIVRLRAVGALVEPVTEISRDGFRRSILDDPVNRMLGRVAGYETADWGFFEQIGPLLRSGPAPGRGPTCSLPAIGQHTRAVLADLGLTASEVDELIEAKVVAQS